MYNTMTARSSDSVAAKQAKIITLLLLCLTVAMGCLYRYVVYFVMFFCQMWCSREAFAPEVFRPKPCCRVLFFLLATLPIKVIFVQSFFNCAVLNLNIKHAKWGLSLSEGGTPKCSTLFRRQICLYVFTFIDSPLFLLLQRKRALCVYSRSVYLIRLFHLQMFTLHILHHLFISSFRRLVSESLLIILPVTCTKK